MTAASHRARAGGAGVASTVRNKLRRLRARLRLGRLPPVPRGQAAEEAAAALAAEFGVVVERSGSEREVELTSVRSGGALVAALRRYRVGKTVRIVHPLLRLLLRGSEAEKVEIEARRAAELIEKTGSRDSELTRLPETLAANFNLCARSRGPEIDALRMWAELMRAGAILREKHQTLVSLSGYPAQNRFSGGDALLEYASRKTEHLEGMQALARALYENYSSVAGAPPDCRHGASGSASASKEDSGSGDIR